MESYHNVDGSLEKIIRQLINKVTKSEYVSSLQVKCEDGIYTLRLGLNCKDASPITFGYQGDEKGFLIFLEKEFRRRKLQDVTYTKGVLINGDSFEYQPIIEI